MSRCSREYRYGWGDHEYIHMSIYYESRSIENDKQTHYQHMIAFEEMMKETPF